MKKGLLYSWFIFTLSLFFPRSGCSISYSSIRIFSHFCGAAKEYTVYKNPENCFRWDDRYSYNFLPRVPPLPDSQTKQCKMGNKSKQNKATDGLTAALCTQESRRTQEMLVSPCWNSHCIKWKLNFTASSAIEAFRLEQQKYLI